MILISRILRVQILIYLLIQLHCITAERQITGIHKRRIYTMHD